MKPRHHRRTRRRPIQLTLESARRPSRRGGWRPGAGRPRGRTGVAHATRAAFPGRHPQHVTLRIGAGVTSLRRGRVLPVVHRVIAAAHDGDAFRIVHFNVLGNHIHLLVEAAGAAALSRGMLGLAVRLARNALRYVLLNQRHHAAARGVRLDRFWIDPFSSAAWFDGWRHPIRPDEPWLRELVATPRPTAPARTWLLDRGWRRWGPLEFDEATG